MHPPLTLHRHPMCAETTLLDGVFKFDVVIYRLTQLRKFKLVIEQFQKCHLDHPIAKFFGECTDLKIKLDRCFRQEVSFLHTELVLTIWKWIFPFFFNRKLLEAIFLESFEEEGKLRRE
ncbi:uncharacterized protein LOC131160724 isoform X1 [Malania oleifera]|uniref:uncharacterized protein LOC131160724 isoform X1 n=1 Tax=Malania oleifera TaxID=397392 RepID=UPI0025ADBE1E|nr:uncharacterized protein LOC131160724 isoform X1 [Malania oleifera]XP_057972574.1 uncharacterized protein LOC131160724 isoform X1 [Malania oleifera]XP_057972575.1 uncharacterized protein LOC131160724 isoform X1 [Malania oleifera]XP_057972576.1 uncharacterized protein LOC131160724 isoform X1 [Malania oleifera]